MSNLALMPEVINDHRELFERFISQSRTITLELLKAISCILGLAGTETVESRHRLGEPSSSCLNLIRYVKSFDDKHEGQNQHTDNGTLTFLLSEQPGLEVISRETGLWEPVLPKAQHAIVNVADTLRFLSSLRFRSAVHRAIPAWVPGQTKRCVVGYFLRAEDCTLLKHAPGGPMPAQEWHDRKYDNYRAPHHTQMENGI